MIEKGRGGEMKGITIRTKSVRRGNKMMDRIVREGEREEWNKIRRNGWDVMGNVRN